MWKIAILAAACCFLGMGHASAQSNVIINCQTGTTSSGAPIVAPPSAANPCPVTAIPGSPTYVGQQTLTAATLAASTPLTVPAGATLADFYPECTAAGTDNQCIRFNFGGTAIAATSAGIASQQNLLGLSITSSAQVILATGATGATANALTVIYWKASAP